MTETLLGQRGPFGQANCELLDGRHAWR